MITKIFYTSNLLFGIYGFSREYRVKKERFFTERVSMSILNGVIYNIPLYNIYYLAKLLNRFEIEKKNLDKTEYKDQYTEFFGNICYDKI